jgi:hypothetical protein
MQRNGVMKNVYILAGKSEEKRPLGNWSLGLYGKIILKLILEKYVLRIRTRFMWLRIGRGLSNTAINLGVQ